MKAAPIRTRCECQARLSALVSEDGTVIEGRVKAKDESERIAPANAIGAGAEQFQVGWQCPHCGRNTVRSFYRGALLFAEAPVQA